MREVDNQAQRIAISFVFFCLFLIFNDFIFVSFSLFGLRYIFSSFFLICSLFHFRFSIHEIFVIVVLSCDSHVSMLDYDGVWLVLAFIVQGWFFTSSRRIFYGFFSTRKLSVRLIFLQAWWKISKRFRQHLKSSSKFNFQHYF